MNTRTNSRKWSWIQLNERRAARKGILLLLLLLTLPAEVEAQWQSPAQRQVQAGAPKTKFLSVLGRCNP
jgi:hypothetical protein